MSDRSTERRVALVTGATRRNGIGAAICRALAAAGNDVAFTQWRRYDQQFSWGAQSEDAPALLEELRATGVRAEAFEVDLSLPETPTRLLDLVTDQLGPLSILVNNAAYSTQDGYEALDAATLDAHYAVNIRGMALLSVEFARRWPGGRGGRIVNLTSGQSLGPMPTELAYAATKGAVEAFTRSLADGVASREITVNAVNPGPTDTGWIDDDLRAELLPSFPFGRIGLPEDAARVVAFLASEEAAWITGQVVHSEGGFRRGAPR
ncbi:MAG: 3-oxoacyl-[acyl-carrier protein] reductase [Thermomicrobiales bacterium]|jgi:3-oxoacyl-[acyl-carrier protein] reductase|nr:3-oxoacyl-[acyl-carrier protein] reductase [Thermomicrobiales bacterium]